MSAVGSTSPLYATFARADVAFDRGEGAWLIDTRGNRWLDFGSGIAVTSLGHAHPHLVETLKAQAEKVWHVSNVFQIPDQDRLAARLVASTFADRCFFTNSGAEALECAIKTARRYFYSIGQPERFRFITMQGAFHGRTLATIAAGGQEKYLEGFGPKVDGFDQVPFCDLDALKAAIGPATAAVLVEPIQGEGGIRVIAPEIMRAIRQICDENGLLLVLDEVQCGYGRTGKFFAHEWSGITPDIMAVAKGIGGGFPLGACLATEKAASGMKPGIHGTTYGGNPLAMAVANAVLDVVLEPGFFERVQAAGLRFKQALSAVVDRHPTIFEEVRGQGLLMGIKCKRPVPEMTAAFRGERLLSIGAGDGVVRLLPPLIVSDDEIVEAVARMDRAATTLEAAATTV